MWHVDFGVGKVLLVRGVLGVEAELDVRESCLDGRYKVVKSVWVRIKEKFILLHASKECIANYTKETG